MLDFKGDKIIIGEMTRSDGSRMRQNKPNPKSMFDDGYFKLPKKHKYIGSECPIHRSSLERRFMIWCEVTKNIKGWDSEPYAIGFCKPYQSKDAKGKTVDSFKQGNYYIDFVVEWENGEKWLVEVKPYSQSIKGGRGFELNKMKWNAAMYFADTNRMKFIIVTEYFKPFSWIK